MVRRDFVFGVDLDGVVANFIEGMKPIAAEWLGVPEHELTDDVSYGFKEWKLGGKHGYVLAAAPKPAILVGFKTVIAGAALRPE